jgi:hypothetical protein
MQRLTFPAPRRESQEGPNGWYTRRWTLAGVSSAISGGAYFESGRHDFESVDVATAAYKASQS